MAQVNAGRVRFVSRGEYNNSTQYYLFDLVDYNGSSYFAKANTTGNVPTNTTYWQLVAEKGNTGGDGPVGPTGNGIASIVKTASAGLIDTYTITYTNGTTTTFNVTNGQDGDVTQEYVDEENERLKSVFNVLPKVSDSGESVELENTGDTMIYKMDLKGNTSQEVIQGEVGLEEEDTSIYVDDVNEDKENYITLKGNTYQETTTGKNLLHQNQYISTTTRNGITFTNNGDGTFSITGTATANTTIVILSGTQIGLESGKIYYLYSSQPYNSQTFNMSIPFKQDGTQKYLRANASRSTSGEITNVTLAFYTDSGNTINAQNVKLMLVEGSTAGDYEPYTNGASPNPDYPQEVEVVTGLNEVEVCGKNLFDKDNSNVLNAFISSAGIIMADANNKTAWLKLKPNTTYTLSLTKQDNNGNEILLSNDDVAYGLTNVIPTINTQLNDRAIIKDATSRLERTFTTDSTNIYIAIKVVNITKASYENTINTLQLEQNSQATTYEAYKGQNYPINLGSIELCKIGTYQDRIYKNNGNWYLHKEVGKVVLNGSERYITTGQGYACTSLSGYSRKTFVPYSNYYKGHTNVGNISQLADNQIAFNTAEEYNRVYIINTSLPTLDDFKSWLSTHNTTCYYVLATPTITEITDTTLISQLNALYNATIYSTTHINTETSNLLPYIDLKYNVVTASPSPDRASEVEVVKGNNTITISNEDGTKTQTYNLTLGNLELCKIGDYQDYFYKDNGNWYKYSAIGKVVLNGSEEWQNQFGESLFGTNLTNKKINTNSLSYCNRFKFHNIQSGLNANLLNGEYTIQIGTNDTLYCKDTNYTNTTDFKNWLSTHNTNVYYPLATPTTTQITDTLLVSQLDELQKAMSYYDKTLITQTNADKPFILDVVGIRDLQDIFNI